MPLTYRDERRLVEYLLDELEHVLAARDQAAFVRTLPTDRCQLGVIAPLSHDVEHDDALDSADDALDSDISTLNTEDEDDTPARQTSHRPPEAQADTDEPDDDPEPVVAETAERSWRPPSSIGLEFVIQPDRDGAASFSVDVSFALFLPYHAPYDEELREAGLDGEKSPARSHVTLLQEYRRHNIDVTGMPFRVTRERANQYDNSRIQLQLDRTLATHATDTMRWRIVSRKIIPTSALLSATDYDHYIQSLGPEGEALPLRGSLQVRTVPVAEGIRVAIYLRNETRAEERRRERNAYRIFGDARLNVRLTAGVLTPIELVPVPEDYQYDREVFAVGRNSTVDVLEDQKLLRTRALGRYHQPRTIPRFDVTELYDDLGSDPLPVLSNIRASMVAYARKWRVSIIEANDKNLSQEALTACRIDLERFEAEVTAFECGVAAMLAVPELANAFRAANRAFAKSGHSGWRLFQIVFIVMQLPALALRDGRTEGEWPKGTHHEWSDALETADLLWFPTGGGKTEAYLGLFAVAALFDRLRGKLCGVTAWLRFPLRMLSVQQLQRSARVVMWVEAERKQIEITVGRDLGDPISLGYFVGSSNTPNSFTKAWSFERLQGDNGLLQKLVLVKDCPACDERDCVRVVPDAKGGRLRHFCTACRTDLPIYVSDDEIYRYLPTLLLGTVDKLATMAWQPRMGRLWTAPEWRCPEGHGYGIGSNCIRGCTTNIGRGRRRREAVKSIDAPPSLHIQDELHLLQEELGAFASHYETALIANEVASSGSRAKIIAATATIVGYEHQARHLYGARRIRRFPSRGYAVDESFYTTPALDEYGARQTARTFAGFRPPFIPDDSAAALCVELLHTSVARLRNDPDFARRVLQIGADVAPLEVDQLLGLYSRSLTYVGTRDKGIRIQKRLERANGTMPVIRPHGRRDFNVEYLASHSSLRDIAAAIQRLEHVDDWDDISFLDATVATSIISHGVDVATLNLMVMQRVPEDVAEYIQASSRSGRSHVGLIIAVLPRRSLRSSSVYDRFSEFHGHIDRLVAPVSINRFARHAARRTYPGIFLGTIYGAYVTAIASLSGGQLLMRVKDALEGRPRQGAPFTRDDLRAAVERAYALDNTVYPPALVTSLSETLDRSFTLFSRAASSARPKAITDIPDPRAMSSLRDVDAGVRFWPDPDHADEMLLQLFEGAEQ